MLLDFFKLSVSKIALERVFVITQFRNDAFFPSAPGSLRNSHNFCFFPNRYGAKLLIRKCLILIPLFLLKFFKNVV